MDKYFVAYIDSNGVFHNTFIIAESLSDAIIRFYDKNGYQYTIINILKLDK